MVHVGLAEFPVEEGADVLHERRQRGGTVRPAPLLEDERPGAQHVLLPHRRDERGQPERGFDAGGEPEIGEGRRLWALREEPAPRGAHGRIAQAVERRAEGGCVGHRAKIHAGATRAPPPHTLR